MTDFNKVHVAIIGCGAISDIYFFNMVHKFNILEVVACCDLNQSVAQKYAQLYGVKVLSIDEILLDESIDIVVNLTNPDAHYAIIKKLLLGGKHVYTEKVLSPTLKEAEELIALANRKGLMLCSAPDTFLGASTQTAKFIIDNNIIGKVTSAVVSLQRDAKLLTEKFPYTAQRGGGIGIDVGIYYSTTLIQLLGPVVEVCGMTGVLDPEQLHYFVSTGNMGKSYTQRAETYLAGVMKFESGVVGCAHFNSRSIRNEKPYIAIFGTEGILYLEDCNSFGGDVKVTLKGETEPFIFPQTHPYSENARGLGVAEMAWAMKRNDVPRASAEMAFHALEVLLGVEISSNTKKFYTMTSTFKPSKTLPRGILGERYGGSEEEFTLY